MNYGPSNTGITVLYLRWALHLGPALTATTVSAWLRFSALRTVAAASPAVAVAVFPASLAHSSLTCAHRTVPATVASPFSKGKEKAVDSCMKQR